MTMPLKTSKKATPKKRAFLTIKQRDTLRDQIQIVLADYQSCRFEQCPQCHAPTRAAHTCDVCGLKPYGFGHVAGIRNEVAARILANLDIVLKGG